MALYTLRKIPLNWYQNDIVPAIDVLSVFVRNVEKQVEESVQVFLSHPPQPAAQPVRKWPDSWPVLHFEGLSNNRVDLHNIFTEYFPNLQRSSALISLFSFFENELDDLCELYKNTEGYKIGFRDLHGKGIERSTLYLEKVAGVQIDKSMDSWNAIRNIQQIRNAFVHSGGVPDEKKIREVNYVALHRFDDGTYYLLLQGGFLKYALNSLDDFFKYLHDQIKAKQ